MRSAKYSKTVAHNLSLLRSRFAAPECFMTMVKRRENEVQSGPEAFHLPRDGSSLGGSDARWSLWSRHPRLHDADQTRLLRVRELHMPHPEHLPALMKVSD